MDYPPKLSLAKLVMVLKANTAKKVRENRFEEVESVLWGDHFWSPSYFVSSAGGASLDKVRRYVQDQRKPPPRAGKAYRQLKSFWKDSLDPALTDGACAHPIWSIVPMVLTCKMRT